jgi:hypothetical protein
MSLDHRIKTTHLSRYASYTRLAAVSKQHCRLHAAFDSRFVIGNSRLAPG